MAVLAALQEPDPRSLAVTPMGLGLGVQMRPESAAAMWREESERLRLVPEVAEGTRLAFTEVAEVLPYGVLHYPLFTLIHDRALFVLEQALRDRFVDYHRREHGGVLTLRRAGVEYPREINDFDDVRQHLDSVGRRSPTSKVVIRRTSGPDTSTPFDGSLSDLIAWARKIGLLFGQRSTLAEDAIRDLRNRVAHPDSHHLLWPGWALETLRDLAEIVNHLWGHATPGGRLYPGPVERRTVVLAWNNDGASCLALAENLGDPLGWDEYTEFALVMATWPAPLDLGDFDSHYETTAAPVDYLWGPGTREGALGYLTGSPPRVDVAPMIGRSFLVRVAERHIWQPTRLSVAANLSGRDEAGDWHLVGADTPRAAVNHVRSLVEGSGCGASPTCKACYAQNLAHGSLAAVLRGTGAPNASSTPPDFRLPSLTRVPRCLPLAG